MPELGQFGLNPNQLALNKKKNQDFNINGTDDLGFSGGYGDQLKQQLAKTYQSQYDQANQDQQEAGAAGGQFNPQASDYYAMKGARQAQQTGMSNAMQLARNDEYNRFNVMQGVNNYNLQNRQVNLQQQMYDDSQNFDLGDVLGTISGVIPFLADGGDVQDSDYFQQMYKGGIPQHEVNSNTEASGDNTLIKAQPGEVIQSNHAGNLIGRDNLKTINEAGKMANSMFGDVAQRASSMVNPQQKSGLLGLGGQQGGGLIDKAKSAIGHMFGGGGATSSGMSAGIPQYADGGLTTGDPNDPNGLYAKAQLFARANGLTIDEYTGEISGGTPQAQQQYKQMQDAMKMQQQQNQMRDPNQQTAPINPQQVQPGQSPNVPVDNGMQSQGGMDGGGAGQQHRKITIESKPFQQ